MQGLGNLKPCKFIISLRLIKKRYGNTWSFVGGCLDSASFGGTHSYALGSLSESSHPCDGLFASHY